MSAKPKRFPCLYSSGIEYRKRSLLIEAPYFAPRPSAPYWCKGGGGGGREEESGRGYRGRRVKSQRLAHPALTTPAKVDSIWRGNLLTRDPSHARPEIRKWRSPPRSSKPDVDASDPLSRSWSIRRRIRGWSGKKKAAKRKSTERGVSLDEGAFVSIVIEDGSSDGTGEASPDAEDDDGAEFDDGDARGSGDAGDGDADKSDDSDEDGSTSGLSAAGEEEKEEDQEREASGSGSKDASGSGASGGGGGGGGEVGDEGRGSGESGGVGSGGTGSAGSSGGGGDRGSGEDEEGDTGEGGGEEEGEGDDGGDDEGVGEEEEEEEKRPSDGSGSGERRTSPDKGTDLDLDREEGDDGDEHREKGDGDDDDEELRVKFKETGDFQDKDYEIEKPRKSWKRAPWRSQTGAVKTPVKWGEAVDSAGDGGANWDDDARGSRASEISRGSDVGSKRATKVGFAEVYDRYADDAASILSSIAQRRSTAATTSLTFGSEGAEEDPLSMGTPDRRSMGTPDRRSMGTPGSSSTGARSRPSLARTSQGRESTIVDGGDEGGGGGGRKSEARRKSSLGRGTARSSVAERQHQYELLEVKQREQERGHRQPQQPQAGRRWDRGSDASSEALLKEKEDRMSKAMAAMPEAARKRHQHIQSRKQQQQQLQQRQSQSQPLQRNDNNFRISTFDFEVALRNSRFYKYS